MTYIQSDVHIAIAEAIAQVWRDKLGVEVSLQPVADLGAYMEMLRTDAPHIFRLGWAADYNDPDNFLRQVFHSGAEGNYERFANADFDRLVDQAAAETDPAARRELYAEAEFILCQKEAAVIPLFHSFYNISQ